MRHFPCMLAALLLVAPLVIAGCGCDDTKKGDNPVAKQAASPNDPAIEAKKAERLGQTPR